MGAYSLYALNYFGHGALGEQEVWEDGEEIFPPTLPTLSTLPTLPTLPTLSHLFISPCSPASLLPLFPNLSAGGCECFAYLGKACATVAVASSDDLTGGYGFI